VSIRGSKNKATLSHRFSGIIDSIFSAGGVIEPGIGKIKVTGQRTPTSAGSESMMSRS